jgi:hypothetical protein
MFSYLPKLLEIINVQRGHFCALNSGEGGGGCQTVFHALNAGDLRREVRKFVGVLVCHLFKVIGVLL